VDISSVGYDTVNTKFYMTLPNIQANVRKFLPLLKLKWIIS